MNTKKRLLPFFLQLRTLQIKELIFVCLFLAIFAAIFGFNKFIPQESIRAAIDEAGWYGPIVWFFITLLTYILAPLSGTPMLFVGFYAFGRSVIPYTLVVGMLGSAVNFYIAKRWGRSIVQKFVGKHSMEKIDRYALHHGFVTLLLLRLFLPNIHEYISYAAGLTTISFAQYYTATLIGLFSIGTLWYSVSLFTQNPATFMGLSIALSFSLTGIFLFAMFIKRKLQKTGV